MSNILMTHLSQMDISTNSALQKVFGVPLGMLDPWYPGISEEARFQILHNRYRDRLIADGIETRNFVCDASGSPSLLRTNLSLPSFMGYIFEAYMVKVINDNKLTIGRNAFEWCTKRLKSKDSYISQWKAIGTGHVTTNAFHLFYYEPQSKFDIIFIRKNDKANMEEQATINGTKIMSGFQVKAITGNERAEIIDPLMQGRYMHVLTCLRHAGGVTSYNVCMDIIAGMYRGGEIGMSERERLEYAIRSPEMIGIDQRNIDEYRTYVSYWYNRQAQTTDIILNAVGLEINNWKYKNGIFVPSGELVD